jgi:aryl-alcohol dehydrogenase-like predicted oxidoreductase
MKLNSFRTLGRSGLRVSPVTLGAMTFGDGSWGADDQTSTALLDSYLDAGGNCIDTANAYNGGRSEDTIGAYLNKHPGLRDRPVIATKFAAGMFPGDPNGGGAGRKAIPQQVEGSLRRLGTDYIDLYWQHNWDQHTPLEETISTLDDLVRAGKIRYIGLSDTPPGPSPARPRSLNYEAGPTSPQSRSNTPCCDAPWKASSSAPHGNSALASPPGARWPAVC